MSCIATTVSDPLEPVHFRLFQKLQGTLPPLLLLHVSSVVRVTVCKKATYIQTCAQVQVELVGYRVMGSLT